MDVEREIPMTSNFEQPLTSRDVAMLLGRNHRTIERHARAGEIPAHQRLGTWYFFESEIDLWLKESVQ
jgi:predicted DNA-binding transcriptional regulator AlpA